MVPVAMPPTIGSPVGVQTKQPFSSVQLDPRIVLPQENSTSVNVRPTPAANVPVRVKTLEIPSLELSPSSVTSAREVTAGSAGVIVVVVHEPGTAICSEVLSLKARARIVTVSPKTSAGRGRENCWDLTSTKNVWPPTRTSTFSAVPVTVPERTAEPAKVQAPGLPAPTHRLPTVAVAAGIGTSVYWNVFQLPVEYTVPSFFR